jgi:superfamily II DNA or RNA helicase
MISYTVPDVEKVIYLKDNNCIKQYYKPSYSLTNLRFIQSSPFIVSSGEDLYFITSKEEDIIPDDCTYALLVTRIPKRIYFERGELKFKRWIKHPSFSNSQPENVLLSWKNKFKFIKENTETGISGLRPPQVGALYSILAHVQNPEDKAIIVMPTGTGKTETMLATLVANECKKLLVAVPSDSLRTQLTDKFSTFGKLRDFGIIDNSCENPIVGIINEKFSNSEELTNFISKVNVVITTMDILGGSSDEQKTIIARSFSHLFVDEAHHSEANTWKMFIEHFDNEKVFLFTATPFRNDGKKLDGKFIFNFSLKKAQEQKYYKEINFLPIREYDLKKADKEIADKAVAQLRNDIANGYNHILMARCVSKIRAKEVFEYYQEYEDLNPVLVYNGIPGLKDIIEDIKAKRHSIIVCVNMLGEGFDLPELKVAAIHDERQSLPITLQFIGRFTRTSFDSLGKASFITNIAYPPIKEELNFLYSKDADWNLLLPKMNEAATEREIDFKEFLEGFAHLNNSKIPFQNINPAMSCKIYKNSGTRWNPENWRQGLKDISQFEHQYSDCNNSKKVLVIILGKVTKVEWATFDVIQNMDWDTIVIHWNKTADKNLVYVHTSLKNFVADSLINAIFGESCSLIDGMDVFKIFHDVKRLTLYNVGAKKGIGRDVTFQSFFGRGVQDGIDQLIQGTLIKNNVFGVGFKDGRSISLGCSVKGKIWSYLRGNLDELTKWFQEIGSIIINPNIDSNTVLENTLIPEIVVSKPMVTPISVEWHQKMFEFAQNRYQMIINGISCNLFNTQLNIVDSLDTEHLRFSLVCEDCTIIFELVLYEEMIDGEARAFHKINKLSAENAIISYGSKTESLVDFFQHNTPSIWFADGSHLYQNNFVKPREEADSIPLDNIITDTWTNVSINKESQGIAPYVQDSIQYYFINKISNDFQIIYDDDGPGEIADIIGINDNDVIDIHLFHLKFAKHGTVGNDISNFYEVCGQAQKSINWKYRQGKDFFDRLLQRKTKTKNSASCSRIIKGTESQLEVLLNAASWTKEMKFHIYIVQPSLQKDNASDSILLLLGNTYHYLRTIGDVELKVYTS